MIGYDVGGAIVPIMFFALIGALFLLPPYLRSRDRQKMYETLRVAYEKGQPVPPEIIAALQSNVTPAQFQPTSERDLRRGLINVAVGLGLCGLGYGLWYGLMSVSDVAAYIVGGSTAGIGAIPGLVGVAHLILWFTRRGKVAA